MELYIKRQKFNNMTVFSDFEHKIGIEFEYWHSYCLYDSVRFTEKCYLKDLGTAYGVLTVHDDDRCSASFNIRSDIESSLLNDRYACSDVVNAFARMYFIGSSKEKMYVDYVEDVFPCYRDFCRNGIISALAKLEPKVAKSVETDPVIYANSDLCSIGSMLHSKEISETKEDWVPLFARQYAAKLLG